MTGWTHYCMNARSNAWLNELMNVLIDDSINKLIWINGDEWMDEWMNEQIDEYMAAWMNGWSKGQMCEWIDEWINEWMH